MFSACYGSSLMQTASPPLRFFEELFAPQFHPGEGRNMATALRTHGKSESKQTSAADPLEVERIKRIGYEIDLKRKNNTKGGGKETFSPERGSACDAGRSSRTKPFSRGQVKEKASPSALKQRRRRSSAGNAPIKRFPGGRALGPAAPGKAEAPIARFVLYILLVTWD